MSDDLSPEEKEQFKKFIEKLTPEKELCRHCFLETHLRAYIDVMADEPDQYIKMSTIYNNLKMLLGDDEK